MSNLVRVRVNRSFYVGQKPLSELASDAYALQTSPEGEKFRHHASVAENIIRMEIFKNIKQPGDIVEMSPADAKKYTELEVPCNYVNSNDFVGTTTGRDDPRFKKTIKFAELVDDVDLNALLKSESKRHKMSVPDKSDDISVAL